MFDRQVLTNDLRSFGKVCQPGDDLSRTAADLEKAEERKEHDNTETVNRHALLGDSAQELWRVAIDRQ